MIFGVIRKLFWCRSSSEQICSPRPSREGTLAGDFCSLRVYSKACETSSAALPTLSIVNWVMHTSTWSSGDGVELRGRSEAIEADLERSAPDLRAIYTGIVNSVVQNNMNYSSFL